MRSGRGEKSQPESPRRPSMRIVEAPRTLDTPAAAVQRSRQGRRSPVPGPRPAGRWCPRAQAAASSNRLRGSHAGEAEGESRPRGGPPARPAPASLPRRPAPLPPSGPDLPDVSRWAGRRYCTRRAAKSRPGPAAPAAARRKGWRPAFVPRFAPGRVLFEGVPATTMSAPCQWAAHPAPRSSPRLHSTSDSLGTARSRTGPRQSSAAARSGSTLFFAAGIAAVPFSGRPPITQIRPLCCVISAAPIPQKIPHDMQKQGRMSRFEFVNVFVSLSGRAARQQPCPLRLLRRHLSQRERLFAYGQTFLRTASLSRLRRATSPSRGGFGIP